MIFPNKGSPQLDSGTQSLVASETSCGLLTSALSNNQAHESKQTSEEQHEDIFTFSSKPRSAPHGKPLNLLSESCSFSVDLKEESSSAWRGAQMEDDFYGSESSKDVSHRHCHRDCYCSYRLLCCTLVLPSVICRGIHIWVFSLG